MKLIFTCLISLMSFLINAQTINYHGTLIIVAIGRDGIMLASDTRSQVGYHNIKLGYVDSTQKIVPIGHYAIGIIGQSNIGKKDIKELIVKFGNQTVFDRDIGSVIRKLSVFFSDNLEESDYSKLQNTKFILAGYDNNMPNIITFQYLKDRIVIVRDSDFTCSNNEAKSYFNYSKNMICNDLGNTAENTIYRFAKEMNRTTDIGGPISILRICPDNSFEWIKNNFNSMPIRGMKYIIYYSPITKSIGDSISKISSIPSN